jgi:hypothetical protein
MAGWAPSVGQTWKTRTPVFTAEQFPPAAALGGMLQSRENFKWGPVIAARKLRPGALRIVILEDGKTVHNAFFDRNFREDEP